MVINEEEKNAFTQSVSSDGVGKFTQSVLNVGGGGGSSVSICECQFDLSTGRMELLEKASVLYEQKKSGTLIAHFKMGSDTSYQESYFDVFTCTHATNGTVNTYGFFVNMGDGGLVNLTANNGDTNPVGYMDFNED